MRRRSARSSTSSACRSRWWRRPKRSAVRGLGRGRPAALALAPARDPALAFGAATVDRAPLGLAPFALAAVADAGRALSRQLSGIDDDARGLGMAIAQPVARGLHHRRHMLADELAAIVVGQGLGLIGREPERLLDRRPGDADAAQLAVDPDLDQRRRADTAD